MLCVPGHGRGVDDIVGIDEQGGERTDKAGYQHDFAIQAAEAGMTALAIEPMGFGCRRDPINAAVGLSRKACDPAAGGALLMGQTMVAWRVWDVMRAIDYVAARSGVGSKPRRLHGYLRRRHGDAIRNGPRSADPRGTRERLPEHVPRQHWKPRPLHRQLRSRSSELGRNHDVAGLIAPAAVVFSQERKTTSSRFARVSRASTKCERSTTCFERPIRSSRRFFQRSMRSGAARHSVSGASPGRVNRGLTSGRLQGRSCKKRISEPAEVRINCASHRLSSCESSRKPRHERCCFLARRTHGRSGRIHSGHLQLLRSPC